MSKRNSWVSPALFNALLDDCQKLDQWGETSVAEERQHRLHLWPETGFSLAMRIILAEVCWMDEPMPDHGGGKGDMYARLDHWLQKADDRFDLNSPGNVEGCMALGTTEIHLDRYGEFEPYTLRLPDEKRQRNPSVRVLGYRPGSTDRDPLA